MNLWEAGNGRLLRVLEGHTDGVISVALDGRGAVLASGSYHRTVKLREVGSGRLLRTLEGHTGGVTSVALDARGEVSSA